MLSLWISRCPPDLLSSWCAAAGRVSKRWDRAAERSEIESCPYRNESWATNINSLSNASPFRHSCGLDEVFVIRLVLRPRLKVRCLPVPLQRHLVRELLVEHKLRRVLRVTMQKVFNASCLITSG